MCMREQEVFLCSATVPSTARAARSGREQHRAGGQMRAVAFHSLSPWDHRVFPLLPSPMHLFLCVRVCASARSEHNGRPVKVRGCGCGGCWGGDSLVFVRVCVAFFAPLADN